MRSYTNPETIHVNDQETLLSLLTDRIQTSGERTVIATYKQEHHGKVQWVDVTTIEFYQQVLACAKGLIALGIRRGDAVAIFSPTRYEWTVLDFALITIGAVSVPIYETDAASQVVHICNDSNVKMIVCDNRERFDRIDAISDQCPSLEHMFMFDHNALQAFEALGARICDNELRDYMAQVTSQDLATIIYTSGSTGKPKGVEIKQRTFLISVRAGFKTLPQVLLEDEPRVLLFLPLAHCFARYVQYCSIGSADGVIGYTRGTATLLTDLRAFNPSYVLGVPRVFEKVYNAASRKAGTGLKGYIFAKATAAARQWSMMQQSGQTPTRSQSFWHRFYEKNVYRTIRKALGSKIRFVASGGAPLDQKLIHFFNGIGLPMVQGYGMTETAAAYACTKVDDNVIGTVGQPVPGAAARIGDDGELQIKAQHLFDGYHNNEELTKQSYTADGWFKTGDLAEIDDEGRITITGRKKDIIITAGGKNVSPIALEQQICQCPIVEHAVVIGDAKPFVCALITLDREQLQDWLLKHDLDPDCSAQEVAHNEELLAEIQSFVDQANATVSRAESIRRFAVLDEQFTQENGCLTPSMKIIRNGVLREFEDVIDNHLYESTKAVQISGILAGRRQEGEK